MFKKLSLLFFVILCAGCDQDLGYITKPNLKAEEYAVKQTITPQQFKKLKTKVKKEMAVGKKVIIAVAQAKNLEDSDFDGISATMIKFSYMPQLTNKVFDGLSLKYLTVENCLNLTPQGISKVKGLEIVELWNMPQVTEDIAKKNLSRKGIKVYDGRKNVDIKIQPVK